MFARPFALARYSFHTSHWWTSPRVGKRNATLGSGESSPVSSRDLIREAEEIR